jgi:hypothetical protein
MKCSVWRAFLGSFVLFLLACGACDYAGRDSYRRSEVAIYSYESDFFPSDWEALTAVLFIASFSFAAGGAVRWWREQAHGGGDIGATVLGIRGAAAGSSGAIEETKVAAPGEVAALPAASLTPEWAHPFEHFDERGRSPLERVLAED